jgi:hypothetical protein
LYVHTGSTDEVGKVQGGTMYHKNNGKREIRAWPGMAAAGSGKKIEYEFPPRELLEHKK